MWIMIAGPYSSGTHTDEEKQNNLEALNTAALTVLKKGHIPVIGVNMALPMIEVAGQASYEDIMLPVSLGLAERCDACLRIKGASEGADKEVSLFRSKGLRVFEDVAEIPAAEHMAG